MITASYFDGRCAVLHLVQLKLAGSMFSLAGDAVATAYPLAETAFAEPFGRAPAVLYFADGARCEVDGRAAKDWLAEAIGYRKPLAVRWQERSLAALAGLVLLLALIGAIFEWVLPAAAERLADALPPTVDTTLGTSAFATMEAEKMLEPSRLSDERIAQVRHILDGVLPAHPRMPVRLAVRAAPQLGANAFAFPDGTIVVTDGMVRRILGKRGEFDDYKSAQLAGVLAHEIGHLERRHSVRQLARSSLTAAGSAALFGDFSAVAAAAPALLADMQYSRDMETDADDYAIAVLRRHRMSTAPLADLFEGFEEDEDEDEQGGAKAPEWMTDAMRYASSHPSGTERGARLRQAGRH